jgi:hypothetical protein
MMLSLVHLLLIALAERIATLERQRAEAHGRQQP